MDTKKVWSVSVSPAPDNNDYYVTYGFGYSKYMHTSNGIYQELNVFVSKGDELDLSNKEESVTV